ncbi:uncharacterized protein BDZ99DRAFT_460258 [Mytilinidion resinicola]|uniref:Uncharacterized protein n=1 Tax=Mytilinidion resinicola TaxID=574789 RepID=A0A6A6YY54_9PEZI|nr:uncharacterized protein BDZ99DRAFT_460258 [Mytilinidion resinicola]KAF2812924.1 hypothetical protein BDZ99DRAFT_460258 [Mytilinidion resinicola]
MHSSTLLSTLFLLLASTALAKPAPDPTCSFGAWTCDADTTSIMNCGASGWVITAMCNFGCCRSTGTNAYCGC